MKNYKYFAETADVFETESGFVVLTGPVKRENCKQLIIRLELEDVMRVGHGIGEFLSLKLSDVNVMLSGEHHFCVGFLVEETVPQKVRGPIFLKDQTDIK